MERIPNSPNVIDLLERDFQQKLKQLPPELAKRWQDDFEDLPEVTPEFFNKFAQFYTDRKNAFDGVIEIREETSPEILEEIRTVQGMIRNTFGDPHHFLGNGYTAEVYELPVAPHLCVKYIKDQAAYNENNHIRKEFEFLVTVREYREGGIRTPLPYFVRIHPSEGHSYGMERIDGKSLAQILERPAENKELIELSKKMDPKDIERRLLTYVEGMHTRFNISHGDIFLRNIMLDKEGNFYIIDFGKAEIEELGEDHEMRRKKDIATTTSEIKKFFEVIDKIDIE